MNGHHIDFRASEMFSQATFLKCSTATRANENGLIWQWKQGQSGRSFLEILPLERIVDRKFEKIIAINSSFENWNLQLILPLKRKGILKSFAIQPVRNLFLDREPGPSRASSLLLDRNASLLPMVQDRSPVLRSEPCSTDKM